MIMSPSTQTACAPCSLSKQTLMTCIQGSMLKVKLKPLKLRRWSCSHVFFLMSYGAKTFPQLCVIRILFTCVRVDFFGSKCISSFVCLFKNNLPVLWFEVCLDTEQVTHLARVALCCNLICSCLEPFHSFVCLRPFYDFWNTNNRSHPGAESDETWRVLISVFSLYDIVLWFSKCETRNDEVKKWLVNVCNYYKAGKYWHVQLHVLMAVNVGCTDVFWMLSLSCVFKSLLQLIWEPHLHFCLNN